MLKRHTPSDVVARITALEAQADRCFETLKIYEIPRGLASWATLAILEDAGERHRQTYNLAHHDAALINLSYRGALILKWIQERGRPAPSSLDSYTWTSDLAAAVTQAWEVASHYLPFLLTFPMWHQDRLDAEFQPDGSLGFTVPGGASARRVSAFHKGFKPVSPDHGRPPPLELTADQQRALSALESQCLDAGRQRMSYATPDDFYRQARALFEHQLGLLFRRADTLSLGPYSVEDLKRVYSALLAVCATHEHLCSMFGRRHGYPINSCVLLRSTRAWTDGLADVSGVASVQVIAILGDLTIGNSRIWDLHVQPFVRVDAGCLAIAPQFALNSRPDENAIRVCGHARKAGFDVACSLKEEEMRDALLKVCPQRFRPQHGIRLPSRLPDIDLLLVDEDEDVVVVAELKWLRKPIHWRELIDRATDFIKGFRQLEDIRRFLGATPTYLSNRGKLARPLDRYRLVSYLLIARDEFQWVDDGVGLPP